VRRLEGVGAILYGACGREASEPTVILSLVRLKIGIVTRQSSIISVIFFDLSTLALKSPYTSKND
jgi:hypothetical protein